jgi:transcriptional repressor NrdR
MSVKCPFCGKLNTKVIDSRVNQTGDIIRRRRECIECGSRFTSYERIEEIMPMIIKKDGRREAFDRDKIFDGIRKASQKRPVTTEQIELIVRKIEKQLEGCGLKEIPSRNIGQMIMAELHHLDKVAYIRFASVYREFRDVDEFVAELQETPKGPDDQTSLAFPFVSNPEEKTGKQKTAEKNIRPSSKVTDKMNNKVKDKRADHVANSLTDDLGEKK